MTVTEAGVVKKYGWFTWWAAATLALVLAGCAAVSPAAQSVNPDLDRIKVIESRQQRNTDDPHQVIITGLVKNLNPRPVCRVILKADVRGWDGHVYNSGAVIINQITNNTAAEFHFVLNNIPEQTISHLVQVEAARW